MIAPAVGPATICLLKNMNMGTVDRDRQDISRLRGGHPGGGARSASSAGALASGLWLAQR